MKNAKYTLLALGAYLALIGVLAMTSSRPGHTQAGVQAGPDVRVINRPAEPVPVTLQGAAQIDTSTPLPVRDVDTQVPFHISRPMGGTFTVPQGYRLVIEYVSGRAREHDDSKFIAGTISSRASGSPQTNYIPLELAIDDGTVRDYAFGRDVVIHADSESEVTLGFDFLGTAADVGGTMTVSGYLVQVP